MNKNRARGASLSVSVILSALFLGGCVFGNEITESEPGYGPGDEEGAVVGSDAPALEPQWVWADLCEDDETTKEDECAGFGTTQAWKPGDFCADDKSTPENECLGAVFTNVD
jgi:hypothetical protein